MKLLPTVLLVWAVASGGPLAATAQEDRGQDGEDDKQCTWEDIAAVRFSIRHPNGWSAWTVFQKDGKVSGGHRSGGKLPFLHMVEDKAPSGFIVLLFSRAAQTLPMAKTSVIHTKTEVPVYTITIRLSDGGGACHTCKQSTGFREPLVAQLAALIDANQRIYGHQSGDGWITEQNKESPADR